MIHLQTPWIRSRGFDLALIAGPSWIMTALVLTFAGAFSSPDAIGPFAWLVLVVGFDVAHVYSTLFRTYLDKRERETHGSLLLLTPLFCWLVATMVYALSAAIFWTLLAYVAVFHFIRQQYGLTMLYATAAERLQTIQQRIDAAFIGAATLYPLVYWHTHLPRAFVWFVEGDFIALPPIVEPLAKIAYVGIAAAYVLSHSVRLYRGEPLNVPRMMITIGTAASWYVGIVAFNGDLAFSATNVVAHAVPYAALIWVYGENRESIRSGIPTWYIAPLMPLLLAIIVGLAYTEEGLWDGFVWREHPELFNLFSGLPALDGRWLSLAVPTLILPQLTHYVLDAFIWRLRKDTTWRSTLMFRRALRAT